LIRQKVIREKRFLDKLELTILANSYSVKEIKDGRVLALVLDTIPIKKSGSLELTNVLVFRVLLKEISRQA